VLALGLLGILVALIPLAHARPPDPLWIAGIYDGADFDEVVVAVVSATGVVEVPVVYSPAAVFTPTTTSVAVAWVPLTPFSALHSRAPPPVRHVTAP
jgi:hypothetical protein